VQSFMGGIMAVGVSSANAILLVSFAEQARKEGATALDAASAARSSPCARSDDEPGDDAGMLPMALALGEGGEQTAPPAVQ
jgi:hypothetical protein